MIYFMILLIDQNVPRHEYTQNTLIHIIVNMYLPYYKDIKLHEISY